MDPLSFDFRLDEFDLSVLPMDRERLKADEAMMRSTLEKHLHEVFEGLPGECRIAHHEKHLSVLWIPESSKGMDSLMNLVMGLVRQRAFGHAETILRTLFSRYPDDRRVLFNLGIILCEQGRLPESTEMLRRLTRAAPDFGEAWNVLGVALSREGKRKAALRAFRKSLDLDPKNGTALRNLGALMARKDPKEALYYLKQAAKRLPSDQSAQHVYAEALRNTGSLTDADLVLKKAIALNEHSEIADVCREARMEIARESLKGMVPRGLRTDIVVFCLTALESFQKVGREGTKAVVYELSSIANCGLNLKDRISRFRLLSLPGEFSALQLVVSMYVGLKKTAPRTDPGIDFSKEYAFALALLAGKKKKSKLKKSRS
ncbi:MAG: tetratricopeptide repeat protein [Desulfobacterota bacterium]|nr:tetratricopeptide repeat protein [Thermodesulfobacteriota bacterium]